MISNAPCIKPNKSYENEKLFGSHLKEKRFNSDWLHAVLDENVSQLDENFPFKIKMEGNSRIISERSFVPAKQPQLFPTGDEGKPLFLINIPVGVRPSANVGEKTEDLLKKIEKESFSTNPEASQIEARKKLAVVVGVNQIQSIDERLNKAFRKGIEDFVSTAMVPYRIEGFFWNPDWECTRNATANVSKEKAYLLLRYLDARKADVLREQLEGRKNKAIDSQIPYSKIRSWIKESSSTKNFATKLQEFSSTPIYFMTMDDDPVRLNPDKGCLSHYEDVIANIFSEKGFFPSVLSLGYQLSSSALPIPGIAVDCDMKVREAMNRIIPGSAYMPEPCTAYYLASPRNFSENLKKFSFSGDGNNLESKKAISNGIKEGILIEERIVFVAIPSLVTTMPERMNDASSTCRKYKTLRADDFQKKEVLQALRGVSHVHFAPINWAHSVYERVPAECKKGAGIFQELSGILSNVFTTFDPITYAYDKNVGCLDVFKIYEDVIQEILFPQSQTQNRFSEKQQIFIKQQIATFDEQKTKLKSHNMSEPWIEKIILAAKESGKALFEKLKVYAFD